METSFHTCDICDAELPPICTCMFEKGEAKIIVCFVCLVDTLKTIKGLMDAAGLVILQLNDNPPAEGIKPN